MKMEIGIPLQVGYAFAEVDGRTAYGAVYVISFLEQEFGKKLAVLARDARD